MWVEGHRKWNIPAPQPEDSQWGRATELCRIIEQSDTPAGTSERKDQPITIIQAVTEYMADARRESSRMPRSTS